MFHKFLKYISQSISGMIGVSVYILADTFFISYKCGADGLAALNLILPVFGLVFAIGSMIGIGSATRYNISTAKGSPSDYYFTQSIFWCLICSIPFMLTGIFIPHKALALLGADAGLIRLGRNYMRIVLLFTPFFTLKIGVKPARPHGVAPRAHADLRPYHRFTTFGESPDMPEPIRDRMGSFFCRTRPLPATPLLSEGMFGTGARARVRVHPEARLAAMENPPLRCGFPTAA